MISKWDKINSECWNANCYIRANDIESGIDTTYNNVVVPYVKYFINCFANPDDKILDIGCGCGFLTNIISKSNSVIGIDISENFIEYSSRLYPHIPFYHKSIFDYKEKGNFNICIATLVIHTISDLFEFFSVVKSILSRNGYFMFIIPHPCFWTYKKIKRFNDYGTNDKMYILPFKINKNDEYPANMVYFHRTLSNYINTAINTGFEMVRMDELFENNKQKLENNSQLDLTGFILRKKS